MKTLFNDNWKVSIDGGDPFSIDLPKDLMISSARDEKAPGGGSNAYFRGGVYLYSKTFSVSEEELTSIDFHIEFEGVYQKGTVNLNGHKLLFHPNGFTPFSVEVTPYLKPGENLIEVNVDNSLCPSCRWYTGGGIYRNVFLHKVPKGGFLPDDVHVETLSLNPCAIKIHHPSLSQFEPVYKILYGGKLVLESLDPLMIIPYPHLWDDDNPNLYELSLSLLKNGKQVDEISFGFGIRELSFTNHGFFVNGKRKYLRGGCVHHDNGILGSSGFVEAEWRKARLLKEAGFNAVRSAHNPCSPSFLDACDYYGLYVMDEAYDTFFRHKKEYDYADYFESHWEEDLRAMVRKDRNHPSLILYSLGNELSEPNCEKGLGFAKKMVDLLHYLDPTRKVTAGANMLILSSNKAGEGVFFDKYRELDSTRFNELIASLKDEMDKASGSPFADKAASPFLDLLDVVGLNYATSKYYFDATHHPNRILFGSETFPYDCYKNYKAMETLPSLFGDFMWTAIDYLGEVGLGGWNYEREEGGDRFEKPYPWIIADSGAMDILGNPNAELLYARTVWKKEKGPLIAVSPANKDKSKLVKSAWRGSNGLPSWSYFGCDGANVDVEVFSLDEEVELFLNGASLGKRKPMEGIAHYEVTYAAGELSAISRNAMGEVTGRCVLTSAKGERHIALVPETNCPFNEGIVFLALSIQGENGVVESNADCRLSVSSNVEVLAFGSAEQKQTEPYFTSNATTYFGRALLCLRKGIEENVHILVEGEGIKPAEFHFRFPSKKASNHWNFK